MMDLIMPVMDGFDAIKLLKQDERTKNIPIIILSNLGQRDEVERALLSSGRLFCQNSLYAE